MVFHPNFFNILSFNLKKDKLSAILKKIYEVYQVNIFINFNNQIKLKKNITITK